MGSDPQVSGVTYILKDRPLLQGPGGAPHEAGVAPKGTMLLTYKVFRLQSVFNHADTIMHTPGEQSLTKRYDRLFFASIACCSRLPNKSTFGTSDPYCKIYNFDSVVCGGNYSDSSESRSQDRNDDLSPVYNETHCFLVSERASSFNVSVYDKNTLKDTRMSKGRLVLDKVTPETQEYMLTPSGTLTFAGRNVSLTKLAAQVRLSGVRRGLVRVVSLPYR